MGRSKSITQAEIGRAVSVATKSGLKVQEIILEPGRVRVLTLSDPALIVKHEPKPLAWPSE